MAINDGIPSVFSDFLVADVLIIPHFQLNPIQYNWLASLLICICLIHYLCKCNCCDITAINFKYRSEFYYIQSQRPYRIATRSHVVSHQTGCFLPCSHGIFLV